MISRKRVGAGWPGLVAAAVLGLWGAAAIAADERPQADDQCVAKCDEASDKCMTDAGGNAGKQRACDQAYDECLRKCG
jgi:hypothetical protein